MIKAFNQHEFNEFILDEEVIGIFDEPVKLKSGRISTWYVNWRSISEDVYLLDKLTDYVIEFAVQRELQADCFFGVPEGASKLGVLTQFKWARRQADYGPGAYSLPMGRGKAKDHGAAKDRLFVGMPKGRTLVLEDTTTTGGSLLSTVAQLRAEDVNIIAAIGLTNRNERRDDGTSVAEALTELDVPYFAMSNALDLLPEMLRRGGHDSKTSTLIQQYFKTYGESEIML